jgi:cellulose synthase/poly-beta-1,6-N-acetylglucosamine synthase-like glycosyltransferase/peptidoglycan/xylan/chitin deacetylase (PgdA/CDA1 family)
VGRFVLGGLALVALVPLLAVGGLVHGDFSADSTSTDGTGRTDEVPRAVQRGGPVIDATGGQVRTYRVPDHTVVLTFDDGPDPRWTPRVLAELRRQGVAATFFVVGAEAARYPALVRQIHQSGSELGVHTFTHPDLDHAPGWRRDLELSETELTLAGAAGVTSSLLRPPYSSTVDAVDDAAWSVISGAGRDGYVTVLTQQDSEDWQKPGVDRILANATPPRGQGSIILMHDAGGDRSQTVAAVGRLIPRLRALGYRFETVSELLHVRTANPAATADQRWRGEALIDTIAVADGVLDALSVFLAVVGVLTVLRLAVMVVVAARHARRRRDPDGWGPPVTEPVSVVVPCYNERECVEQTLRSLIRSDHLRLEVIVVDDGSTDGTADLVEELALPGVTLIRKTNGGKPSALNAGIAAASHEIIVMVDGDTVFEPDSVRRLVRPLADPTVGAVAGNAKVGNRDRMIGRWQHIEYVLGFNLDRRCYDLLGCMPTVPGAIGAFRRRVLHEVGGVSGRTLAEDTDLTMSICQAGWRVVYEESALAWTEAPATAGQLWRQRYRWSYGTMQAMWWHRRAVFARGAAGRFGRRGLPFLVLFQVLLPALAPLIDVFLLYGLVFLNPVRTALFWLALLAVQLGTAVFAFRLDRERLRPLWALPLQQFAYRQLMYLVIIQSVATALAGARLPWQKLTRTGTAGTYPRAN